MGRPFVGPSGRLLNKVLDAVGVERKDIYVTNATLCAPQNKTDKELALARECCRPRLEAELTQFPDRPVLALGAVAGHTFIGDKFKITEMAGSLHDVDVGGMRPVIPTHHPARILRGGDGSSTDSRAVDALFWALIYDAGKVVALAEGRQVRFTDDVEIVTDDSRRARSLLEWIEHDAALRGFCAIDLETIGERKKDAVVPHKARLTALAVATDEWAVSVADSVFDKDDDGVEAWNAFIRICENPKIHITFHNRLFDEAVLHHYDIPCVGPVDDTMLMHHAAFPGAPHKLQPVGTQFFAIPPWKAEFRHGKDTLENLLFYNARDTLVTARLDAPLRNCMAATDSQRVYAIDNALAPYAIRMERVGVPIDRHVNQVLYEHFDAIIKRTKEMVETRANASELRDRFCHELAIIRARKKRKNDPDDFIARHAVRLAEIRDGIRKKKNPDEFLKGKEPTTFSISNVDHIAAYLAARGHRIVKLTASGKPSTRKEILEEMGHIEDVREILLFREAFKQMSTIVVGLPLEGDPSERWARLHISWDLHKITGRWGSSPNGQNWTKGKPGGAPNVRRQVTARKRKLLVGADFAQLEARLNGWMAGDPFMISIFMDNFGVCPHDCLPDREPVKFCPMHDIHTVFAAAVYHNFLEMDIATRKVLRDLIKRAEYGAIYGARVETLYSTLVKEMPDLQLNMAQVAEVMKIIAQKMPFIEVWHNDLIRQAMREGEIRSPILGRRRCFPLGNCDPNVIYNFPAQAGAADIVDLGILKMMPMLAEGSPSAELLIQGHDSVLLEVDEDQAEACASIVTEALTQTHTLNVRGKDYTMFFPANADIAENWKRIDQGVAKGQVEAIVTAMARIAANENETRQTFRLLADERIDPDDCTHEIVTRDQDGKLVSITYEARPDVLEDFWHDSMDCEPVVPPHSAWKQIEKGLAA